MYARSGVPPAGERDLEAEPLGDREGGLRPVGPPDSDAEQVQVHRRVAGRLHLHGGGGHVPLEPGFVTLGALGAESDVGQRPVSGRAVGAPHLKFLVSQGRCRRHGCWISSSSRSLPGERRFG
ncbi:hypothetical protein ACWHAN_24075 [Streptomyces albidoflavus]